MNIGITCYPTLGGSGAVATELGETLAKRGHQVHFITFDTPFRLTSPYHENVRLHEVQLLTYPLFKDQPSSLALAAKMAEVASSEKLDILHVHYAIPHAACAVLAKYMLGEAGPKIITTLHGTDITLVGNDPSFFSITKFAIEKSDVVTCVSEWLREQTIKTFDISREILTVYNSVNVVEFRSAGCVRDQFASPDEKVLIHLSNFRPVKRVSDVVDIFSRINNSIPSRLLMVGDGPERPIALWRANNLNVADRVTFMGQYPAIEEIISCADLLLLPSEHESFGMAALEAMACGVPVVGSRSGGLPEVVADGECGYLADVGDCATMAEKAAQILSDKELAEKMGQEGRARAEELFNHDKIVSRYEQIYRSLLR